VKKILGVALIGGVLFVVFVWAVARGRKGTISSDDPAAMATLAPGTASAATSGSSVLPVTAAAAQPTDPPRNEATVCARLEALCSTTEKKVDASECEQQFADARKMSGEKNVERSEACVADAQTCAAATGCLAGGVGMGAVGEFLKGLGAAISK